MKLLPHLVATATVVIIFLVMRGSRKFCHRGSNSDNIFICILVDGGREDPNTSGKIRVVKVVTIGSQFKWRFAGGPMVAKH